MLWPTIVSIAPLQLVTGISPWGSDPAKILKTTVLRLIKELNLENA